MDYYTRQNSITDQMKREVLRIVAKYMIKTGNGDSPSVKNRRRAAAALKGVFPLVWPDETVLVGKNCRDGSLSYAFKNHMEAYNKKKEQNMDFSDESEMDESEMVVEEDPEEDTSDDETDGTSSESANEEVSREEETGVIGEEEESEDIRYLRHVIVNSSTLPTVKAHLDRTRKHRLDVMMDQPLKYMFDIFRTNPELLIHEFNSTWPEHSYKFLDQSAKFVRFVQQKGLEAKKNFDNIEVISSETEPFEILVVLLGRVLGGASKAVRDFVRKVHAQATQNEIKDVCSEKEHPFIIIRASTPPQYIISVDGKGIFLSPIYFPDCRTTFDLLYKVYWLFNIEYPKNLKKFYAFFERSIYDMKSSNNETSPIMLDLIGKYKTFEINDGDSDMSTAQDEQDDTNTEDEPQNTDSTN